MAVGLYLIFGFIKAVIGDEEGFIVGGDVVETIKEFPHVAFLALTGSDGSYICGSSILNQVLLVTAAHCLDDIHKITASVGSLNRDEGTLYIVKSFEQHKQWDPIHVNHDIGLCRLKKPLTLGNKVKRVVLMKHPPKTHMADLAGWGAIEEQDYDNSIMLKHTRQKLWTHQQCQRVLHNAPRGTICGGQSQSKGNFASKGDSGSGLLVHKDIIVGLVSYKDTSISRSLVVYTSVPYYYDWVKRVSKQMNCS
ncbi:cathepsin G-like isoform X1 [Cydia amplana]|uniref:cathepsin G-like isoform X1 n=2 Tax=Cydia amplana TaxID=1869771 RepID=UPI002FE59B2D